MSYLRIIGLKYPDVRCHATGIEYEDIVWESSDTTVIPISKTVLDQDLLDFSHNTKIIPTNGSVCIPFSLNAQGIKNSYLSIGGDVPSNAVGFICFRDAVIANVSIGIAKPVDTDSYIFIRKNRELTDIATIKLPAGKTKTVEFINLPIDFEDEISIYSDGTPVDKPLVLLELVWR